jgi:hypothetical protein
VWQVGKKQRVLMHTLVQVPIQAINEEIIISCNEERDQDLEIKRYRKQFSTPSNVDPIIITREFLQCKQFRVPNVDPKCATARSKGKGKGVTV